MGGGYIGVADGLGMSMRDGGEDNEGCVVCNEWWRRCLCG